MQFKNAMSAKDSACQGKDFSTYCTGLPYLSSICSRWILVILPRLNCTQVETRLRRRSPCLPWDLYIRNQRHYRGLFCRSFYPRPGVGIWVCLYPHWFGSPFFSMIQNSENSKNFTLPTLGWYSLLSNLRWFMNNLKAKNLVALSFKGM